MVKKAFPLGGRWRGPRRMRGKLPASTPSSVTCGDSFPQRGKPYIMCAHGAHSLFIIYYLIPAHHFRRVQIFPVLQALQMQVAANVRLGRQAAQNRQRRVLRDLFPLRDLRLA